MLIVELSALLHDVLDKKYVPPASYGHDARAFFEPFFQRAAVDLRADGRADTIVRIVENVSWSNEQRLRASGGWGDWHETCVELHCVQDADRLDAIGAFGECPRVVCTTSPMLTTTVVQGSCVAPHTALSRNGEVPLLFVSVVSLTLESACMRGQFSPLHVPDDDADQPESAIQHFHDKLLHIQERMKTTPGKQMAEKRHKLVR